MWIDPRNADRLIVANRPVREHLPPTAAGRGMRAALPIAQMYHVSTDNRIPYFVYGNRQDGPAHGGPSNSLSGKQILPSDWQWVGGSESGWTFVDPADPNMVLDDRTGWLPPAP